MKLLKSIDKTQIEKYENLINENFDIDNKLHSKIFNRNKLVKVAIVTMKNGKTHNVYDYMRTTKYTPETDEFKRTNEYLDLYKQKIDMMLT